MTATQVNPPAARTAAGRRPLTALAAASLAAVASACSADRAVAPAGALASARNEAPAPAVVRIGVFSRSAADLAAVANGYYAAEGLTVQYLQVQSSTQQAQFVRSGQYDMVTTAADNVVNYALNDDTPIGERLEMRILMQADNGGTLRLVAQPGIAAVADLESRNLAVDARASGFAYVLYKILRLQGLELDRNYTVTEVGGSGARYNALTTGATTATLLSGGFELRAANAGYRTLATVSDAADPYAGSVLAATPAWLADHGDVAVRVIRAQVRALRWVRDPANREAVVDLLDAQPNTDRALAEQIYDSQQASLSTTDGDVDRRALYNVLAVREEFGGFEQTQNLHRLVTPAGGLYDVSYWRRAVLPANGRDRR